jgi:hypothetical protein
VPDLGAVSSGGPARGGGAWLAGGHIPPQCIVQYILYQTEPLFNPAVASRSATRLRNTHKVEAKPLVTDGSKLSSLPSALRELDVAASCQSAPAKQTAGLEWNA